MPLLRLLLLFLICGATADAQRKGPPVHPDAVRKDGVPKGTVTQYQLTDSKIFPGTTRDYWIYVPAQYDGKKPAALMVFQDGRGYVNEKGHSRIPIVFDNLIHSGEMPVTVGVFVNPGVVPPPAGSKALPRFNRSFEYDGVSDRYARFLDEEILPEVEKLVKLDPNPDARGICGSSSGGVAAFTVAWHRPDMFRRVYTLVGTYIGLRGAERYPILVRKTEPKPLRIFLQDGSNDLDIYCGDWWVANQDMLSALKYGGYEVNHSWDDGPHGARFGGAIMPDVMRWLWKDYPKPVTTHYDNIGSRSQAPRILIEGEDWEQVSEGHAFTEGPAVNDKGELFFSDLEGSKIHKVDANGKASVFVADSKGTNGLAFGRDGRLYGAQRDGQQVVAWDMSGKMTVLAKNIRPNDLVVAHNGNVYVTEPRKGTVWLIRPNGEKVAVESDMRGCNGVVLSPDQSLLNVADFGGRFVYSYQVQPDGTLKHKQQYHYLHVPVNQSRSEADGMCVDQEGWLYVATAMGIQVCDQPGRVNLIIPSPPGERKPANVTFGGANWDVLYATCGSKVFKRKVKMTGALPWKEPVVPKKPQL
jgi:sugar lactone lactonase YvrE/enterochelin esterase-like enzyme